MIAAINAVPVTTNTIFLAIEIAVGVVVSVIYIKSRIPKQTIQEQAQLITILQQKSVEQGKELLVCREQHAESLKMIHVLEGKIEVLQNIPLQSIAQSIAGMNGGAPSLDGHQSVKKVVTTKVEAT